ncbi:MAG: aldo/keto reductase, partial [Actinomycetes bacterium]
MNAAADSIHSASRIVLGTAQFGMDYGLTNTGGQVSPGVANTIIDRAWERGVRWLDTAHGYG